MSMCHRNKMILLGCILALTVAGVLCVGILAFHQKPKEPEGVFVQAFRQSMERCGL